MKLNYLKTFLISGLLALGSNDIKSEEIEVSYKSFYSHVRKLNNEDTKGLQFAFGFMHIESGRLCTINSARISTQKQQIPLIVSPENRFTIQSEKALRLANALVVVDIQEAANKCDMSVQLETKPELLKATYTSQELTSIYQQYQAFFNEMGSFLSFMMPTVKGLTIQFADQDLSVILGDQDRIIAGTMNLSEGRLNELDVLELPSMPLRITALASK
ncbi:DUF2987 domain-containing protein [Glaciecola sp. KUL10]|uniref:DUF2987 domain-containing protein n=1 Tax=Glaciecola sp. (strain KUL10) TaxID=2161813 RepID=UPI000D782AE0|nr:DUF2987 domain-containing protein [Glaciecola sp. KUL10]GBL02919.1 hypothetical protein KUL10_01920 [Glaciecola sp. KUL10]